MAGPDDAAGGVDVEAVLELREELGAGGSGGGSGGGGGGVVGGDHGAGGGLAEVELGERGVDEVGFAETGFELAVAAVGGFVSYVVGVGQVVHLDPAAAVFLGGFGDSGLAGGGRGAGEPGFVGPGRARGGRFDEADGSAAVAVLGGDHDDAVGGDGAAEVRVRQTRAPEAVREYHGREPAAGRGEQRRIGDCGEGNVVEQSGDVAIRPQNQFRPRSVGLGGHSRNDLCEPGARAQEPRIGAEILSLVRFRQPSHRLRARVRVRARVRDSREVFLRCVRLLVAPAPPPPACLSRRRALRRLLSRVEDSELHRFRNAAHGAGWRKRRDGYLDLERADGVGAQVGRESRDYVGRVEAREERHAGYSAGGRPRHCVLGGRRERGDGGDMAVNWALWGGE